MEAGGGAAAADDAQAWRDRLTLRLLRSLVVIAAVGFVIVAVAVRGTRDRAGMLGLVGFATLLVGVAAATKRPTGKWRAWMVVIPAALVSLSGFAFAGCLSGPGACLTVTLMLTGLLLGRRAMIGLMLVCAAILGVLVWALASARFAVPDPRNTDMASVLTWGRSLGITFLANILFGVLMVAVVAQMERSVELARQETVRRETAERARAEAERAALEGKQLEVVGRLAAGIAHDFNNNLTAIMGCAELLRAEVGEGGRELADSILQSSRRVADLTRQLLAYSRKAQMQQAPTDLHGIVREAISLVSRSMHPNVQIVTKLDATSATVVADVALLQNAILNMLVNAGDSMPDGGTLTVSTSTVTEAGALAGPTVLLEVSDTGHGIEKDLVSQVFEPFFTTKPLGKGTGLGLAVAFGIVKQHQGFIQCSSRADVGSRFTVYLPRRAAARAVPPSPSVPTPAVEARGGQSILFVDDEAPIRTIARTVLERQGYRVRLAADGAEAVEVFHQEADDTDLVIVDLTMPRLTGTEVVQALRAVRPGLRIILSTGHLSGDALALEGEPTIAVLHKPYTPALLLQAVRRALEPS